MSTRTVRKKFSDRVEWTNEQGQLHRLDGPAIEWYNGARYWYLDGELHREDGPAVEYPSGYKEWYLNGKIYLEQNYKKEMIKIKLERLKNL